MAADVLRQRAGGFVAPATILLETAHDDPVEIAAQQQREFARYRHCGAWATLVRSSRPSELTRADGRGGSTSRILRRISSKPSRSIVAVIDRLMAGQQFVEQHTEAVDVAARIDVEIGDLGLLRARIRRRADERVEASEERLVREPALRRLRDAEVDHLRHGHAVVDRDENVRGLDVAVDDPFLVRVLDRVADLDEQLQARGRRQFVLVADTA